MGKSGDGKETDDVAQRLLIPDPLEQRQYNHRMRRDVELMTPRLELDLNIHRSEFRSEIELATGVFLVVERLKRGNAVLKDLREGAGRFFGGERPEIGTADDGLHVEGSGLRTRKRSAMMGERQEEEEGETHCPRSLLIPRKLVLGIVRDLDILHHPLRTLRERRSRLDLELRQHAPLRVVRNRTATNKALGEMRVVVLLEGVLLGKEAEEGDGFVEDFVDFGFGFLYVGNASAMGERR
jgi:hypothetical protein